jgi:hypothetical protein
MLVAIAEMVEREGLDGYRIAWSMPLPASPVSIVAKTTLRPEPTVRPSVEDEADLAKNHEPADAA